MLIRWLIDVELQLLQARLSWSVGEVVWRLAGSGEGERERGKEGGEEFVMVLGLEGRSTFYIYLAPLFFDLFDTKRIVR